MFMLATIILIEYIYHLREACYQKINRKYHLTVMQNPRFLQAFFAQVLTQLHVMKNIDIFDTLGFAFYVIYKTSGRTDLLRTYIEAVMKNLY